MPGTPLFFTTKTLLRYRYGGHAQRHKENTKEYLLWYFVTSVPLWRKDLEPIQ